jgi:undecaprenyl-diphosphatase
VTWWEGVILGVVQGLTEFLPVSSSGHLVVAEAALRLRTPGVFVEVVLHVATLAAVAIVYARRIGELTVGLVTGDRGAARSVGLLLVASVPAGVIGLALRDAFQAAFDSLALVGADFLVTGVILWVAGRAVPGDRPEPTVRSAIGIGCAQALAILPGISRSGSTVAAGIFAKIDPVRAAEFSFLMAVPAIAGAAILQLPEAREAAVGIGLGTLALSFFTALVSGVFAIRLLLRLLARRAFHRFAPYCWAIGIGTLAWSIWRP